MCKTVSILLRQYTRKFADPNADPDIRHHNVCIHEPFKNQLKALKRTYARLPWTKRATFKKELQRQLEFDDPSTMSALRRA
jgi:hypothetical protein